MPDRRPSTATSRFGTSRRESHDASAFYARFTPPELSSDQELDERKAIDQIFCRDARSMPEVPDRSVALVVTSPPYFAGKEYEEALGDGSIPATYLEYIAMLEDVFAECVRKLEPGGRIAVNVANLGRRPYRSLSADVVAILQDKLRLLLRGEVIWQKARGSTGSCAWGSFQRPANPVLRDLTERVVIASKGRFDRALKAPDRYRLGLPSASSLSRDEFMEATTDVWEIASESATRVGHPAPFPVALPARLIHLYTYYDDLVLDPFMGAGSTAVAAVRTGRHFAGYDTDEAYVARARERVAAELADGRDGRGGRGGRDGRAEGVEAVAVPVVPAVPAAVADGDGDPDVRTRLVREGRLARDVAEALLRTCGFTAIGRDVRAGPGVEVSFRACDGRGRTWLFEVVGGLTSTPGGLKRADLLWKSIAKGAVLREVDPEVQLVLLATDVPATGSTAEGLVRAVTGPGRPISAVIELLSSEGQRQLATLAADGQLVERERPRGRPRGRAARHSDT